MRRTESRAHGDDRRDVEFVGVLAAVVSNDSLHRFDNHDEVDRAHPVGLGNEILNGKTF